MSRPLISKPGFYPDISCEDYFAEPCPAPALTNSGIRLINSSCPAKFAHNHPAIGQPPEDTKNTVARQMGNIVHRIALGKGQDYAESPYDAYRSNEAKEWKAKTEEAGLIPVKSNDLAEAKTMAARIEEAIHAETRGRPYQTEVVFAWKHRLGFWCRGMLDVWCPELNLALDVKTAVDASDGALTRVFANGYAGQAAWYSDGIFAIHDCNVAPTFGFLFVEKDAPFLPRFAECSAAFMDGARVANDRAARIFDKCLQTGEWPGYAPHKATPPAWWIGEVTDYELEEID